MKKSADAKGSAAVPDDVARRIEGIMEKPPFWMDTPTEQPVSGVRETPQSYQNVSEAPETKGFVPIISWVQAGQWQEAEDMYQPGYADEFIPCPKHHSLHTYALRVQGDSMTAPVGRSYPEGAIIYVDPDQRGSASPGDRVIAKLKNSSSVTFKQLAQDGDRVYLRALNPHHPPLFDEFKILGKVIGMWVDD